MTWVSQFAQGGPPPPVAEMPGWMFAMAASLLTLSLAAGLWLFLRFNRAPLIVDPACGACGYLVRGLSTFICPECGADLRDVGIVKSGRGSSGIPIGPPMVWVLLSWVTGVAFLTMLNVKGAPNGNAEQWLAIVLVLTWAMAAAGLGLIGWWMRSSGKPAATPVPPVDAAPRADQSSPCDTVTRNLSIMFIDVVDYTALAAKETRDGLLVVIRKARDLVKPIIARHRGTLVKTMGDGFLITFDSPTNAVLCGRNVQAEAARRMPEEGDKALRFRIGVTTGEVAIEDDDVFGDPVNLASRIQQLAAPGDVFFSDSTWHAMTRSEVPHEEAGSFEIKGVSRPVTLYRAVLS